MLSPEMLGLNEEINVFEISPSVEKEDYHLDSSLLELFDPREALAGNEEYFANRILMEAELMHAQARSHMELKRMAKSVTTTAYILEFLCPEMPEEARERLKKAKNIAMEDSRRYFDILYWILRQSEMLTTHDALFILAFKQLYPYKSTMMEADFERLKDDSLYDASSIETIPILSYTYPETRQYAEKMLKDQTETIKGKIFSDGFSADSPTDFVDVYMLGNLLAAKVIGLDVDVTKVSKLELTLQRVISSDIRTLERLYEMYLWCLLASDDVEVTERGINVVNFAHGLNAKDEYQPIPKVRRF